MKNTEKRIYNKPIIEEISIDRVIVLQITSNDPPPQPGNNLFSAPAASDSGDSSTPTNPTQKSGFEENPFER